MYLSVGEGFHNCMVTYYLCYQWYPFASSLAATNITFDICNMENKMYLIIKLMQVKTYFIEHNFYFSHVGVILKGLYFCYTI